MKTVNLTQGTPEWLAHRAQHFNASDAPAMMGCSPYKTRAQLLRELHTGVAVEVDQATQRRFDDGHRFEALARPLAEEFIGDPLYPVVGVEGRLSASFDGLTLLQEFAFEHKHLNNAIRAAFKAMDAMGPHDDAAACRLLPIYHRVQMEQQLHVSGAERVLFMASEWTSDGELVEQRHCWYYPDADLRAQIIDGWRQFERDLAAYVPPASAEPAPAGRDPDTLPALRIEVTGMVTASNLGEFKATALSAIRSVNRDLKTDQDFADAEKAVKWCADVESRLKAAKEHALSQTADIDALFKTLDDISAEARAVRLDVDKLVKRRKDEVREQAVTAARRALDQHIAALQAELAPMRLQPVAADFAGAIKGLRSIASMQDALDTTLANAKIDADAQARVIRGNVAAFKAATGANGALHALFHDLHLLVHKAADDFAAVLDARIAKHRADEAERERLAAERRAREIAAAEERAREQERARLAAEQRQREEAEAAERAAAARMELTEGRDSQQVLKAEPATADATDRDAPANTSPGVGPMGAGHPADAGPAGGNVARLAPAANEPPTVKLGDLADTLGFQLRADFIEQVLGIKPAGRDRAAILYRPRQVPDIVSALQQHLARVQAGLSKAA